MSDYYDANAEAFRQRTFGNDLTALYDPFTSLLPAGGHILDAGCGPGRDALAFLRRGFRVTAIDASPAMVELASQATGQPALLLRFEEIEFEASFDGIWACASLVHVPRAAIDGVLARLSRALVSGGVLYASLKCGDGERVAPDGRFFSDHDEASLRALLARHPELEILRLDVAPPGNAQDGRSWLSTTVRRA